MAPNKTVIPLLFIIIGEAMIFHGLVAYGIAIHILNLFFIYLLIIKKEDDAALMQKSSLLPLLRIVSIAMPVFPTTLYWYLLVCGAILPAIYVIIKMQRLTYNELGIGSISPKYIPVSIVIGFFVALIEHQIINPVPLLSHIDINNIDNIIIFILIMIVVASVEEVMFRSLIQTAFEQKYGAHYGLLMTSVLYGVMHSGYGSGSEIAFEILAGLILGRIFQKTRSLPFVVMIHGFEEIFLFSNMFALQIQQ